MKQALLIIDAQNDFCHPDGALSVPGANEDMKRLAKWIDENGMLLDNISVTLDSHHVNDIGHPPFWQDKDGNQPQPFSQLTADQVKSGEWSPRFYPNEVVKYLEDLENEGEFTHTIWPVHCIIGTKGNTLFDPIAQALVNWEANNGKYFEAVVKGTFPLTEHFGVFQAQIPVPNRPETQLNQGLIQKLQEYDRVFFAGEAKSHCVATSLKQALKHAPTLAQKFVIFEDCMSPVPGFETLADPIYDEAKKAGIEFTKTTDVVLGQGKSTPAQSTSV